MTQFAPEWVAHQRARFLRHDAHRFLRHDWQRFVKPGAVLPWPLSALVEAKANFDPNQPRVPAGNSDGGQWTAEEGESGDAWRDTDEVPSDYQESVRLAQLEGILDDAGRPYYSRGGHHEAAREVYGKWKLTDEVRRIFDKATTGTVPRGLMRFSPDGEPQGHFWKGRKSPHGIYNDAVKELSENFLQKNGISPDGSNMTISQAYDLLREIRETSDPRIRNYNRTIRLLRSLFHLRSGRGNE